MSASCLKIVKNIAGPGVGELTLGTHTILGKVAMWHRFILTQIIHVQNLEWCEFFQHTVHRVPN